MKFQAKFPFNCHYSDNPSKFPITFKITFVMFYENITKGKINSLACIQCLTINIVRNKYASTDFAIFASDPVQLKDPFQCFEFVTHRH